MASTSGAIAGYCEITIDGEVWDAKEVKYTLHGYKRETAISQNGVVGYTAMPVQGSISGTLFDRKDRSIKDIMNKSAATVIVRAANGKVITGNNMWLVEQPELSTQEGTYEFKFEGKEVTEDQA
ncbi:phage tail tube protein [Commensalibacter melissae]|uniref:phage tail tube protein n=1 Tax=Commensalibacter melissae TaxID=2070537 RepID=UPI000EFB5E08|nr:phage tail tube protein [Commensalibacter melissae]AYN86291.1 phage tail protein [Commensalibacter melissae]